MQRVISGVLGCVLCYEFHTGILCSLLPTSNNNICTANIYATLFFYSAGGVELLAKQGRIKVVNTLESRLEMMSKQVWKQLDGIVKPRKTGVVYCSASQFGSKLNSSV